MDKTITIKHKELASGRWAKMSLVCQLANIGSEVSRAINWRKKGKMDISQRAFFRALELIDLTISSLKDYTKLREILRMREALVDFFYGENEFKSSDKLWLSYFDHFAYLCRNRNRRQVL